jgi:hypothetical protein
MSTPRILRAGLRVCLCVALIAPTAVSTADQASPRGTLAVDRDLVRAGTKSRLNWQIELPGDIVDVTPGGEILPKTDLTMRVRTLGVAFQSGRKLLPIAAYWSLNGTSWNKFFYDYGPNVDPTRALVEREVKAGDRINFGARGRNGGWYPFHSTGQEDHYVTVLRNGDSPPAYAPAYDQGDIVSFMRPYIDDSGRVRIGPRDLIVLFECSTSKPGSPYFDMQDIVLLLTFEETTTGLVSAE